MANKTVQLKDREGNNLYPKTTLTNVMGLTPGLDNRHIFFGSGTPSNLKSSYEDIQKNDLYINTNSDRYGIFYRAANFYNDNTQISWDLYGYYFMKSGTPPTTGPDWSIAFGGISPYPRKGLLWCDTNTGHIYEFTGTPYSFTWRCLTDNYSKSELETMIAAFQPDIDEKADRIEDSRQGSTIILEDSAEIQIPEIILFGKSVQNGTPSIDNPVSIVDITEESINITDGIHTQTGALSKILRGIPVTGDVYNYIDQNNQKWICDTIEKYKDGSGKYIQRVVSVPLNGSEIWTDYSSPIVYINVRILISGTPILIDSITQAETTLFTFSNDVKAYVTIIDSIDNSYMLKGNRLYFSPTINGMRLNASQFMEYLSNNNAVFECCLETPIETSLTAEELAQLDLSTYYPITNITSNPDIEITYVADTKNYFDKKIEQVRNAIISNGGNV